MAGYLVAQIKVTDEERWSGYRAAVGPLAERFGGRQLVAGTSTIDVLEGSHDDRGLVVFEFESLEAVHRFWASPEYAALKEMREGAGLVDAWAVPGV